MKPLDQLEGWFCSNVSLSHCPAALCGAAGGWVPIIPGQNSHKKWVYVGSAPVPTSWCSLCFVISCCCHQKLWCHRNHNGSDLTLRSSWGKFPRDSSPQSPLWDNPGKDDAHQPAIMCIKVVLASKTRCMVTKLVECKNTSLSNPNVFNGFIPVIHLSGMPFGPSVGFAFALLFG